MLTIFIAMLTGFYSGLLALLYFKISLDTIQARRKHGISLGVGGDGEISSLVSAHANFAAYAVFLLMLLFLLETSEIFHPLALHTLGMTVFVGRVLHYLAFRGKMNFKLRIVGMHMTLWPLLIMGIANVLVGLYKMTAV